MPEGQMQGLDLEPVPASTCACSPGLQLFFALGPRVNGDNFHVSPGILPRGFGCTAGSSESERPASLSRQNSGASTSGASASQHAAQLAQAIPQSPVRGVCVCVCVCV